MFADGRKGQNVRSPQNFFCAVTRTWIIASATPAASVRDYSTHPDQALNSLVLFQLVSGRLCPPFSSLTRDEAWPRCDLVMRQRGSLLGQGARQTAGD